MKLSIEKLVPEPGQTFRCFDRRVLTSPVKWHRHPEIELTYVPDGSGSRLVGDHIGAYSDHDLVLLGSNLPHTWSSDEYRGSKYDLHSAIVIQFHPEFLGSDFFQVSELAEIDAMLKRAERGLWFPPDIAQSIGGSMQAMTGESGSARLIKLLECLAALALVSSPQPLATAGYTGPATRDAETRIRTVCDYIQQNLTDPAISPGTLANLLLMNPSAFGRFFKQATGRTPSAYVNELRIGLACRQLIETDKSVLQICLDTGFVSTSYFNRSFRKLRSMSPREYRTQHARNR